MNIKILSVLLSLLFTAVAVAAPKIQNADIKSNAAIAFSKMAPLTASRVCETNGSGVVTASSVTSTVLGYIANLTSDAQTQLDGKQPLDADLTSLAGASSTDALYYRSAAGTWSPVTIGSNITFTGGTLSASGGGGGGTWGSITGTLSDQTDLNTALGLKAPLASPSFTGTVTLPTGLNGLLKATSGVVSTATSGTDYAPATSGTSILKGNGSGGFSSATSGTDYAPATSGTGYLKGNGSGGFTSQSTPLPAADLPAPAASAISASAIDWSTLLKTGGVYTKTLGANTTFTFSNLAVGTIVVRLTNTASNYTVTWPTVKWPNGTTPTMTTGAKADVYTFIYDGTDVFGSAVQNF